MESIAYEYHNAPVPGGGFVTGFVFHEKVRDVLYARTDIGGVYRFDFEGRRWVPLIDHATHEGRWESFALSIALDPTDADALYIAAGDLTTNKLCVSHDRGETFAYYDMPCAIHGNWGGRATGERLIVKPDEPNALYFGSLRDGLFVSRDSGKTWSSLPVRAKGGQEEKGIAFVWCHPANCKVLVVSTNGAGNAQGNVRGSSLYISRDGGAHWNALPGQPAPILDARVAYPGFVGQRAAFDGTYLYVTLSDIGNGWRGWDSYACDVGSSCDDGRILRYRLDENGYVMESRDVTPDVGFHDEANPARRTGCGLSGICCDPAHEGALIASSICDPVDDAIFFSPDRGLTWKKLMQGLEVGRMNWTVEYMEPRHNGGLNLIHWMSDLKINPFDANHAVFNTGTGVFMCFDLQNAHEGRDTTWQPESNGMEETVHLNIYSPTGTDVHLIDIIGDLGGFAFKDLTKPCTNSFADADGNRYITCMNADFADGKPEYVLVTPRGNWKGKTKGGLILSRDACETWERLPMPWGLSDFVDELLRRIEQPNVNSGWCAVTADAGTLVWGVAQGNSLPACAIFASEDEGRTWKHSEVYDLNGQPVEDPKQTLKVMADRVDPQLLYGFGDGSAFYVSRDGGRRFEQRPAPAGFPVEGLGGIDGRQPCEIRVESGKAGVIWMAMHVHGLWRIVYDKERDVFDAERVSAEGDVVYRQGMGKAAEGCACRTLYIAGVIGGVYGFFRSTDEGRSWVRINNDRQNFGDIRSVCGDPRVFGRIYVATGTRGVLWGEGKPLNACVERFAVRDFACGKM